MAKYLISFPSAAMNVPDSEWEAVGRDAHAVIRDAKEAFSVKPRFQEHFKYLVLDVEDNEEQNLIRLFPG